MQIIWSCDWTGFGNMILSISSQYEQRTGDCSFVALILYVCPGICALNGKH